ncbi:MAG: hypothetical protein D6758_08200 [Gammaproteobacteria bacterium]|nr:MAG: hypothetical protein D6758_08200 [Gammaproteobacteria bacterium]
MDRDTFNRMVSRYRSMAKVNPEAYDRAVRKVVREGYLLIGILLALGLGLVGGMTALALFSPIVLILLFKAKIGFLLIPVIWAVLKSLFVRFQPPEGYSLTREMAPALFDTLDQLQSELDTPRVNRVMLDPEFNACISVVPRFGWFGPPQVTLVLGLELLMCMSERQARSVLAHELGHLTRRNFSADRKVYRLRWMWGELFEYFAGREGWATWPVRKALNYYVPRLNAITYAAAQREEYKADAVSAQLTSPEDAASALTAVNVLGPYLETCYWNAFGRQAVAAPRPRMGAWAGLSAFWKSATLPQPVLHRFLNLALDNETDGMDTHPCLADRLKHFAQPPRLSLPNKTAAECWLGPCLNQVIEHFDARWWEGIKDRWQQVHEAGQQARQALDRLLAGRRWAELSVDELRQAIPYLEILQQDKAIRQVTEAVYRRDPDDADNRLRLTRLQAEAGDAECLETAKTLLQDAERAVEACYWAVFYMKGLGEPHPDRTWWEKQWEAASKLRQRLEEAFDALEPSDTIVVPELPPGVLDNLRHYARQVPDIEQLWIAQRVLTDFRDVPCYIMVLKPRNGFVQTTELAGHIAQEAPLPFRLHVLSEDLSPSHLVKPICRNAMRVGVALR